MSVMNKRALLVETSKPFVIEEKPVPEPPPKGLVLKTCYTGICHSDVHLVDGLWDDGFGKLPYILGHEIAGEVYSIGKKNNPRAEDLKVGDRIILFPWCGCHQCAICKGGAEHICELANRTYVGSSNVEGGYQQYVTVEDRYIAVKIPDNIPFKAAGMLACSALTAYHGLTKVQPTIEKFIKIQGSATLVIIGAGGLGHWAVQFAKVLLPKSVKVVCADKTKEKFASALSAGADDVMLWSDTDSKKDIKATESRVCGEKVHAFLNFVNSPTTNGRALSLLARGGIIGAVGLFGGKADQLNLQLLPIKDIAIKGILTGTREMLKEVVNLVATTNIKPPAITEVSLEEAFHYIMRLKAGTLNGRAVVNFVHKL